MAGYEFCATDAPADGIYPEDDGRCPVCNAFICQPAYYFELDAGDGYPVVVSARARFCPCCGREVPKC